MAFRSYMNWLEEVKKLPFEDIILGVKDTIQEDTLYISLGGSKIIKMDNTSFAIGYTYNVVLSVKDVDSPLVGAMSNLLQDGLNMVNWSNESHLYNYQGSVYLPVGKNGQAWS